MQLPEMFNTIHAVKGSPMFRLMTESDIENCLKCSKASIRTFHKNEMIFLQGDAPTGIQILVSGKIIVGHDSYDGSSLILNTFSHPGDIFGEVFSFLNKQTYDNYAESAAESTVLTIPKNFMLATCGNQCRHHSLLIQNMMAILSEKAYKLSKRVQILSASTLRQKIARTLLQFCGNDTGKAFTMSREKMAGFLCAARPSLSRELMLMQDDGLIRIDKRNIYIEDPEALNDLA